MLSRFHKWLIKIIVGKEPVIMNVYIHGEGIKDGWSVVCLTGFAENCIITSKKAGQD
jgi:hypothetical protein